MARSGKLMRGVAAGLGVLNALNWLCLLLFAGVLLGSIFAEGTIIAALEERDPSRRAADALGVVRVVMLLGLACVPLAHLLLTRLRAMVLTVDAGDPFVPDNARRLTVIAWALLGIQLCDLGFGYVSLTSGVDSVSGWTISMTGWIAVALLFVLARVFDHGARLRDELAGTV
jgi:hypothetical protein